MLSPFPTTDTTNGDIQATDFEEATGTELTTSETATDLHSQSGPANIGLIIGIVIIVIVVVALVAITVVVIIVVLFKKRGIVLLNKKRVLSNPMYSACKVSNNRIISCFLLHWICDTSQLLFHFVGGLGSSSKQKYDTNSSSYDYVENQGTLSPSDGQGGVAVYQEAVLYHSVGPDVSKPAKTAVKADPLRWAGPQSLWSPCYANI